MGDLSGAEEQHALEKKYSHRLSLLAFCDTNTLQGTLVCVYSPPGYRFSGHLVAEEQSQPSFPGANGEVYIRTSQPWWISEHGNH